ncbi:CLUMA_CG010812, isoform A [Clunio marinus]|uniref:CLUMA_CG010812, isoform A n=1 Tax=Clunio marinus TaxID=568069 RepID=A0A1J1IAW0_9DIPT|nr:CLUMA_CG010812, isoform A [Clunio marinus]
MCVLLREKAKHQEKGLEHVKTQQIKRDLKNRHVFPRKSISSVAASGAFSFPARSSFHLYKSLPSPLHLRHIPKGLPKVDQKSRAKLKSKKSLFHAPKMEFSSHSMLECYMFDPPSYHCKSQSNVET